MFDCAITCCKDCKNRHRNCHDECEVYLKQRDELNKLNAEIAMKKACDRFAIPLKPSRTKKSH